MTKANNRVRMTLGLPVIKEGPVRAEIELEADFGQVILITVLSVDGCYMDHRAGVEVLVNGRQQVKAELSLDSRGKGVFGYMTQKAEGGVPRNGHDLALTVKIVVTVSQEENESMDKEPKEKN